MAGNLDLMFVELMLLLRDAVTDLTRKRVPS